MRELMLNTTVGLEIGRESFSFEILTSGSGNGAVVLLHGGSLPRWQIFIIKISRR